LQLGLAQVSIDLVLRSITHASLPLVLLALSSLGCMAGEDDEDGEEGDEAADGSAPSEACLSGTEWVGGNAESPRMHPGTDCLGCHQNIGEAQEVTLAGTVYGAVDEVDDCFGVSGVTVQITDADGQVTELETNSAGNFLLSGTTIAPPYNAKLIYEGRERAMVAQQTELSCNSCHTETGANNAPGRILAP
jgi:hypothetical protein